MIISSKSDMYARLHRGDFGNTVPMWFDVQRWVYDTDDEDSPYSYSWWGVRSLIPGGLCFLNVKWSDVVARCAEIGKRGFNISPMVDRITTVTLWANVWDSPTGLIVEGIEYPPKEVSWRELMPLPAHYHRWELTAAKMLLAKHMNPNSLNDLKDLIEKYPAHVYEFSCLAECFGTVPHRNTVIWEVRSY